METEARMMMTMILTVAIGVLLLAAVLIFTHIIKIWLTDDTPCYELRRLTEADTFTVCGDAVATYLESGCCHVLGREGRE